MGTHNTKINGTTYEVVGGRMCVSATNYKVKNGYTTIGSTKYDILLPKKWAKYQLITSTTIDGYEIEVWYETNQIIADFDETVYKISETISDGRITDGASFAYSVKNNARDFVVDNLTSTCWVRFASDSKTAYRVTTNSGIRSNYEDVVFYYTATASKKQHSTTTQSKGKFVEYVYASEDTYPEDGIQGNYWYVLQ